MYKISELKTRNGCYYLKEYVSNEKEYCYEEKIIIDKVSLDKDGFYYIFLYDENMEVIRDTHVYLNIELRDFSQNSRDSIATSLKLLYSFIKLFNMDICKLDKRAIAMLKEFLYGGNRQGRQSVLNLETVRGSRTVNKYLSFYRSYLKYLGIENKILNETRTIGVVKGNEGLLGHTVQKSYDKYTANDRVYSNNVTVPMYVKELEFKKILEHINEKHTLREEIIVRLMYENGMRIGEVLGLTLEDIMEDKIYIRNRLSDKTDQLAKTCLNPKSKEDYKHFPYATWKEGYQIIKPCTQLLDRVHQYIEIAHGKMSKTNRKNYVANSIADRVTKGEMLEEDNYYLFLNKDGKPLGVGGWNKILRGIFKEIGLAVDKKVKVHNLNHRFRHGFAMKRVREGASEIQLANDLRHKSLSTVQCYVRATEEDVYDANKFGVESMMKKIPFMHMKEEEI